MDLTMKLSLFVFLVSILMSLQNQKAAPATDGADLQYDYYSVSCPSAERIIWSTVRELFAVENTVAPQLLRLLFHDCFVNGCDASIMLDSEGEIKSEKESPPNGSIKGFEEIDIIKSKLEEACPGVVSCADILALAARESVVLVGGQFYPVLTGRKDSIDAFQLASNDLPRPDFTFNQAINSFASKGFDVRETVALLGGGHSVGEIHCNFIRDRLFNFTGTNKPDPAINAEFLEVLRSECSHPSSSASGSFENRAMRMDYKGTGKGFGEVYYHSLLQGRGLLVVDQQLTAGSKTRPWVESYVSDSLRFRTDFAEAMIKLSHLPGSSNEGEVRLNCRKRN